jgi:hypothetical protein
MSDDSEQTPKKPGGVKHDARGNAVWQWAAESGRHAIESTSRILKRLEVPGLELEEDRPKKGAPPEAAPAPRQQAPAAPNVPQPPKRAQPPDPVKGYDPYGGRLDGPGAAKKPTAPTAAAAAKKPAATTGDRPSLLSRLFRKR